MEKESNLQERIGKKLQEHEIYPFSIFLTYAIEPGGVLSITFFNYQDLERTLDLIDYKVQCDKTGYQIFKKSNTMILKDLALVQLYLKLC